jgi:formylglycine-generating enzyme required for sulfatase activity
MGGTISTAATRTTSSTSTATGGATSNTTTGGTNSSGGASLAASGSAWDFVADSLRGAYRGYFYQGGRGGGMGFRCARAAP